MDPKSLNPYFQELEIDHLYHLGVNTGMNLNQQFGDIKYVIFTLSNAEAKAITNEFAKTWYNIKEEEFTYQPICKTERFYIFKVGPTLIISIGVGMPSLLIALNEITKLLFHVKQTDFAFFKLGFAGGLGTNPGDLVISNTILNGKFETSYTSIECGETYTYPTIIKSDLAEDLFKFSQNIKQIASLTGATLSTHDFYDGQARLNGALPISYTLEERDQYLNQAYKIGVRAIDMESLAFAGFCDQLNIKACILNITIIDRFKSDRIEIALDAQMNYLANSASMLAQYIKSIACCEDNVCA